MANFNKDDGDTYVVPFLDTNYLMNHYKEIKEFFIISTVTLEELEDIKTSGRKSEEVKYKARRALRFLTDTAEFRAVSPDNKIYSIISKHGQLDTPDNIICATAKHMTKEFITLVFYSEDLACRMIAQNIFKLEVADLNNKKDQIYKGYRKIIGTTKEINSEEFWDTSDWNINEYCICTNTDTGETTEMRFNGNRFVELILPPSNIIKGKNSLQRCALDLLYNPDITINAILGTYGSGKTFLSTKMGVHQTVDKGGYERIVGIRSPRGEGESIGYLPGDMDQKVGDFFIPMAEQLDMGMVEYEHLKERGTIETTIPFFLKGRTFNDTWIITDEAEDLTQKELKLIGTRVGSNSKIVFSGDYKQSILNTNEDNNLIDMCNQLKGNKNFGCIYLEEDIRSETSKIFAGLWN